MIVQNIIPALAFLAIFLLMLWGRKKKWITDNNIGWLADTTTIIAFFLALYIFVFPGKTISADTANSLTDLQSVSVTKISPTQTTITVTTPSSNDSQSLLEAPALATPDISTRFFFDGFDSSTLDLNLWIIQHEGFDPGNGVLHFGRQEDANFIDPEIEARLNGGPFKRAKFGVRIINGGEGGFFRFIASCNGVGTSLFLDISKDHGIVASFSNMEGIGSLPWGIVKMQDDHYYITLIQEENIVRTFVNEFEMSQPFPCQSMGEFLRIIVDNRFNHIDGYIEYVALYSE